MKYLPMILISIFLVVIIYRLIPSVLFRFSFVMREIRKMFAINQCSSLHDDKPINPAVRISQYLHSAGISSKGRLFMFAVFYILVPFYLLISGYSNAWLFAVCWICIFNSFISHLKKRRSQYFGSILYKVYRFINMELESGLILGDILVSLPESTDDKELRAVLARMSNAWRLTGDLDLAVGELEQIFGSHETALLANNLRQCLLTGVAGKAFGQMENLLFARYVEYVRRKSKQLQGSMLLCSILALLPVIILMLWPIISEMLSALASVFGS